MSDAIANIDVQAAGLGAHGGELSVGECTSREKDAAGDPKPARYPRGVADWRRTGRATREEARTDD